MSLPVLLPGAIHRFHFEVECCLHGHDAVENGVENGSDGRAALTLFVASRKGAVPLASTVVELPRNTTSERPPSGVGPPPLATREGLGGGMPNEDIKSQAEIGHVCIVRLEIVCWFSSTT